MSTVEPGAGSGRQVFRTPGSVVLCWAWLVVAVLILGSVALRGHNHAGAVTALVVLAITGAMYACAWQPRIVTDADGITVQNPLRWHLLPWPLVTSVQLVQTVEVHYTVQSTGAPGESAEKKVHSWAVQSSAASRTRAELRAKRNARTTARMSPRSASQPAAGYGQSPDAATAARQGSAAEFIARQLTEKVEAAHRQATAAPADQAPAPRAASAQRAEARWAWWQIAAIAVPVVALIAVAFL
jgi:Bacterial PH domain